MKSIFASKTFWFNALSALAAFLGSKELAELSASATQYVVTAVAAINIVLRYFFTSEPVSLRGN